MTSASTDLLIQQWRDKPTLRSIVQIWLDVHREQIEEPLARLALMHSLDDAVGVWLDYIGQRLGIGRPAVPSSHFEDVFGFDLAGEHFDEYRFADIEALEVLTPLGDSEYRMLIRARGWYIRSGGTLYWLKKSAQEIDRSATVTDNQDMTVTINTGEDVLMALALRHECLAVPVGIHVTIT